MRPCNRWQPSVVLADPENKDLSRSSAASNVATPGAAPLPLAGWSPHRLTSVLCKPSTRMIN